MTEALSSCDCPTSPAGTQPVQELFVLQAPQKTSAQAPREDLGKVMHILLHLQLKMGQAGWVGRWGLRSTLALGHQLSDHLQGQGVRGGTGDNFQLVG